MKAIFSKYKYELGLLILSVLWISFLYLVLQIDSQQFVFPDSYTYLDASEKLYNSFEVHVQRPTLIAAINGFPLLFGFSKQIIWDWSIIINCICWLLTILLLFSMLKKQIKQKTAFLLTLFYIVLMSSSIINFDLLSESVFTLFLTLTVFLFSKYFETNKFHYLLLALSVMLLSLLVKPILKIGVVLLLLFYGYTIIRNLKNKVSLVLCVSFALLFGHLYLMKKQFGEYTISYIDTLTYYNYLGTRADCLKNNTVFEPYQNERQLYFNTLPLSQQKNVAYDDLKSQLVNNPINLFKAYGINLYNNSFIGTNSLSKFKNYKRTFYFEPIRLLFRILSKIERIFFSILALFLPVYFLIKSKIKDKIILFSSIVILYLFFISGISSDEGDRFYIVFYPLIIVLLARFIYKIPKFKPLSEPLQK